MGWRFRGAVAAGGSVDGSTSDSGTVFGPRSCAGCTPRRRRQAALDGQGHPQRDHRPDATLLDPGVDRLRIVAPVQHGNRGGEARARRPSPAGPPPSGSRSFSRSPPAMRPAARLRCRRRMHLVAVVPTAAAGGDRGTLVGVRLSPEELATLKSRGRAAGADAAGCVKRRIPG